MKGINKEIISEVANRANILEVVSEHVVMKRSGKDYKGLCPFHPEKSPSFFVNSEKGIYKCFGCGEGGDVFTFVQKIRKLDFIDTVRDLAQRYGVALIETESERGEFDKRSTQMLLYQQAAEYFARLLEDPREGLVAREYLENRGITSELCEKFKLGYAPAPWDGLLRYLTKSSQVTQETLVEAGLARRKPDSDHCYDLFRNRLMIPILDEQGRVIAFGGRTLSSDDPVKYINSPETLIYTKGEHLFALNQAKDSIRQSDSVIVVEGYFDAITSHAFGFTNTVAALGTALTERQAKLLCRYTESKRVYLCFDADTAGVKAVERGMEVLTQVAEGVGIEMRVIQVPGAKDPDECLRSKDPEAGVAGFSEAVEHAPLLIDYRLETAIQGIDYHSGTGRVEAGQRISQVLATIKSPIARAEYIRQWSAHIGVPEEALLNEVGNHRRNKRPGPIENRSHSILATKSAPKEGSSEADMQLLALYLISQDDYATMQEKLAGEDMIDPVHQRIKESIEGIGNFVTYEDFWQRLTERLAADSEAKKKLWDLDRKVDEIRKQNLSTAVILKDARARLVKERLIKTMSLLRMRMDQNPGEEEVVRLQSRIMQLHQLQQSVSRSELDDALKAQIDAALVGTI
ncbi:MAG: DNA primase [Candidatus Obscuribacterales bacterium]|nr:DNA primase [Candidatus Obscuribacterales bacterium]